MQNEIKKQNYNQVFNYLKYFGKDYRDGVGECNYCGRYTSEVDYLYQCCNCERNYCENDTIDVEFTTNLKRVKSEEYEYDLEECEPFIDQGKYCRECVFSSIKNKNI